jgi:hypothetical protein
MDVATALNFVSTLAIVIGVVFAAYQLYVIREQREREVHLTLARSLQTAEFQAALQKIVFLPEGLSKAEIDARLGPDSVHVFNWFGTMETLGVLMHDREVPMAVVDNFFSGPIVLSWRRLQGYVADVRRETRRDTMHEWFQWLAERFIERESTAPPVPAHVAYRDWTP